MTNKSNEKFWIENPLILFEKFCKFNPFSNKSLSENLNAYTRFILILIIVLFSVTKQLNYIYFGVFLIIVIIIIYYTLRKDTFQNFDKINNNNNNNNNIDNLLDNSKMPKRHSDYYSITKDPNNPLKNVPITDYDKKQEFIKSTNSDFDTNKFVNGKFFRTSDDYIFDKGTRQYYTTANTSVPNDQTSFANWLYGTENICKEGSIYLHRTGTPEQVMNCNGFNVASPTNFGNLNN